MKVIWIIALSLLTGFIIVPQVDAHVLRSDGTVGAVMHVTPEDDPIAGEPSDFYFEFKDTASRFSPEACNCVITIKKAGEEVYSQPLFINNSNPNLQNASFSYTFPEKNVYTVEISGKPKTNDSFTSFTLTYDLRVEREKTPEESQNTESFWDRYGIVVVAMVIAILAVGFFFLRMKHNRSS